MKTQIGDVDPILYNSDLRPISPAGRTWTSRTYLALWVGMCINAATWTLASTLLSMGMNWIQAVMTIVLGNLIVLIPMLCNSHAGSKHGISFPVFIRASFGIRGSNLPALLRAAVGCGWFGIQTWFTALALDLAMSVLVGKTWSQASEISLGFLGTQRWTLWLCFAVCCIGQLVVVARGFDAVKRLQQIAAPVVSIAIVVLFIYLLIRSKGDFGPVVTQESSLGWGREFWVEAFPPGLMANIAFWAALSLNMPDFTRFAKDHKSQIRGQVLGLPTSMLAFSVLAIFVTSLAAVVFDTTPDKLWSPDALVNTLGNPVVVIFGAFLIVLANFSTNVAANMVGPALDITNSFPKYMTFRLGLIIVTALGVFIMPWKLLANADSYVYVWLGFYGGITGAVGGVVVADYWLVKKTSLKIVDLFRIQGEYTYFRGWNLKALAAFIVGAVAGVGGAYSPISDGVKSGPFPEHGFIPPFQPLYDYNWVVSFLVGMAVYILLNLGAVLRPRAVDEAPRTTQANEASHDTTKLEPLTTA
ncbi:MULTISPECIES: NCS1 family nucleobase:cation symporter-1 [Actinomycetes]|uniref:NCS1 family nucleobase:cation symporter-1 n=1 Tax=Actinomycetes TaxID=1760 RepID=UPI00264A201C|nr:MULTISPECIES: NCS1 family nucleobase:cation symporter-1 [Actinomycetes]MDN6226992.1 NCS1 family nucleobase:cation symporter-1 [Corynebacterium flavescens]MDN6646401.1 NCS1 family nucleobase:cation symporter-1 [Corynebacterium flavescens]MDN6688356.1 NCS1 family nucleobase:cation symporter-1 [Corynebacterium flavescens]